MATIDEMAKELKRLYAKARSQEGLRQAWELGQKIDAQAQITGWLIAERGQAVLLGFWARYHELLKFGGTPERKEDLYKKVRYYFRFSGREEVETVVNYGYLLSEICSQLLGRIEEAAAINQEIEELVKDTGNIPIALKVAGALGSTEMARGEWEKAIAIFDDGEKRFPARQIQPAWQHLANVLSQRGLSKLNLSDQKEGRVEKLNLISSAIVDLRDAEDFYIRIALPPLKHFTGIENRLIMAAIRLLLNEGLKGAMEIGQKIQQAFNAEDRVEAKRLISELKAIEVLAWDKIGGEVPGSIWSFVRAIQLGLKMSEECLREKT